MQIPRFVCEAKTDKNGTLTPTKQLPPNQTFSVQAYEEVAVDTPFKTKDQVAEWIDSCVLGDLRTLQLGIVVRFNTQPPLSLPNPYGGGNFLLAAGCCMAIEYFGTVYRKDGNGTERAKAFVMDFLGKVDARYVTFFELIWSSFRNGIVHGSWPQSLCITQDGKESVVVGASVSPGGQHFAPHPASTRPSFILNSETLLNDLHRAFEPAFKAWILDGSDPQILERASAALLNVKPGNKDLAQQVEFVRAWKGASKAV